MKHNLLLFIFFLFFSSVGDINGQESNYSKIELDQENVRLTLSSQHLFVGEYLYYSIFAFNEGKKVNISKIGYVSLVNSDNQIIFNHKLKLKNGHAQSNFFLPTNLKTGHYKLFSYTNWSLNNAEINEVKNLIIINPFTQDQQDSNSFVDEIQLETSLKTKLQQSSQNIISIETSKTQYSKREFVELSVNSKLNSTNTNFVLSVKKIDEFQTSLLDHQNSALKTQKDFYLPEMRGQLITGYISSSKNLPLENRSVSLSISGNSDYIFKIANSNSKGEFYFNLDEDFETDALIYQVLEDNKEDFEITINESERPELKDSKFSKIIISKNVASIIKNRSIENQIENAFYTYKQDTVFTTKINKPFYNDLGTTYVLDDYTRFKTFKETFVEVIETAGIRKKDSVYNFVVFGDKTQLGNETLKNLNPLILVDGIYLYNADDLYYYDSKKIASITTVSGDYLYGNKLFHGIIDIITITKDFKQPEETLYSKRIKHKNTEKEISYYQPNYSEKEKLSNIPDYRRQLLWKTGLLSKTQKFSFYSSDVSGTYEVKLTTVNQSGKKIEVFGYFEVK
jgi:hypothetical protein